jgi:tRNA pseudouridine55 synthase
MTGILIVAKAGGMTSHDVVDSIRAVSRISRVGHAGTLDPNATGVLVMMVGKATKISRFLMGLEKEYDFTIQLGRETDTLDGWGTTLRESEVKGIGREQILAAAARFTGRYRQTAPSVSALKHKGVRLYKLARQGKPVPEKTRMVTVSALEVTGVDLPLVKLRTVCSTGTYVRSLARDIGRHLGCGACVTSLRRLRVGPFKIEEAVRLSDLVEGRIRLEGALMSVRDALEHLPRVRLKGASARDLRKGRQPLAEDILETDLDFDGQYVALEDEGGTIVAVARRPEEPGRAPFVELVL